jgi:DNA-binding transcriptional MerR regulator
VRIELALLSEKLIREKTKENQGKRNDLMQKISQGDDNIQQKTSGSQTREQVAELAGVSHDTVSRYKETLLISCEVFP